MPCWCRRWSGTRPPAPSWPTTSSRSARPARSRRGAGGECPVGGRVYTGGRGYSPTDALELGADNEIHLPQVGTITNFAIVTPVQYPGQTETEPFVRAFVLLDDTDVILVYQPVIELPY